MDELCGHYDNRCGHGHSAGLIAVADAQLAKARVTISEAEISVALTGGYRGDNIAALLRSKGVEVVP